MTQHTPGRPGTDDRDHELDDGEIHVVQDGSPGAPAVLLLQNAVTPTALWDPVIPSLASAHRVIRVDLVGPGRSSSAVKSDVSVQCRRAGAVLDSLGAGPVTVIGHSSGGIVATALAEQQTDKVAALALINTGPSLDAKIPDGRLTRLLEAPGIGRLLWRLKTADTIRKAARTGFTRPVDIPDALIEHLQGMTHRSFAATMRAYRDYLSQRSIPDRLAGLGLPVLVIFGADDQRWHSASAAAYRAVPGARVELLPGVGHTPMMEDPQATASLLLEFAAAAQPS
jgi:pimeloyl-ACP methyl ester carboxylesterase